MKNNYQSLIEKNLSTKNSISESQQKIKKHAMQIAFIDQNIRAMSGYKLKFILNKRELCINFPTVFYNCMLEKDSGLKEIKERSDLYKKGLTIIKESIVESAFLVIRIKNIKQLLLTTSILKEYANAGDFQLPLTIIVCSKEQLSDVQNNLNEIPIPVICSQ